MTRISFDPQPQPSPPPQTTQGYSDGQNGHGGEKHDATQAVYFFFVSPVAKNGFFFVTSLFMFGCGAISPAPDDLKHESVDRFEARHAEGKASSLNQPAFSDPSNRPAEFSSPGITQSNDEETEILSSVFSVRKRLDLSFPLPREESVPDECLRTAVHRLFRHSGDKAEEDSHFLISGPEIVAHVYTSPVGCDLCESEAEINIISEGQSVTSTKLARGARFEWRVLLRSSTGEPLWTTSTAGQQVTFSAHISFEPVRRSQRCRHENLFVKIEPSYMSVPNDHLIALTAQLQGRKDHIYRLLLDDLRVGQNLSIQAEDKTRVNFFAEAIARVSSSSNQHWDSQDFNLDFGALRQAVATLGTWPNLRAADNNSPYTCQKHLEFLRSWAGINNTIPDFLEAIDEAYVLFYLKRALASPLGQAEED